MRQLSIVIVNWNTGKGLEQCIQSVREQKLRDGWSVEMIVVDNASKDSSLEYLRGMDTAGAIEQFPLQILYNEQNLGFAKACNQGAEKAGGEYILFLNPDMILQEDTLLKCFEFLGTQIAKDIGVIGIQLVDEHNIISRSCSRLPKKRYFLAKCLGLNRIVKRWNAFMLEWDHKNDRYVDEVIGAFFLVKKEVFESLEGFDERFFVYYEEVDFCKRVHDAGYKVFYYTGTKAFHEGGGASAQIKDYRLFYELRSRYQYVEKHEGKYSAWVVLRMEYLEYYSRYLFLRMKGRKEEIIDLKRSYGMLREWVKMKKTEGK